MGIKLTEVGGVWRKFPEPGDRYKYFMGNAIVEVIGVGMNTEFGDDEVIFRSVKGLYTSSINYFLGRVNKSKFPDAKQEYYFEQVKENG